MSDQWRRVAAVLPCSACVQRWMDVRRTRCCRYVSRRSIAASAKTGSKQSYPSFHHSRHYVYCDLSPLLFLVYRGISSPIKAPTLIPPVSVPRDQDATRQTKRGQYGKTASLCDESRKAIESGALFDLVQHEAHLIIDSTSMVHIARNATVKLLIRIQVHPS